MEIIADLHLHSRFARATSKNINLENLEKYARIKGLGLLGTGDFQHPLWKKELDVLEEREGILYTKTGFPFLWQTEISLMYSQNGKGRRLHHVILAPNKEVVKQITEFLASKGRLDYDGRPIFGFSSVELADAMQSISDEIEIIPAHCMTPWFGIFGSKTGFDNLKGAFQDKENKIHAVESGMSADPEMLHSFSWLNDKTIVSFSDSHSFWPWRIGREATIFEIKELAYKNIINSIRQNIIKATIETDPLYGRYHYDGHRLCNFSCNPKKTRELRGLCPACGKPLTIGVEYRIEELTDQEKSKAKNAKPFYKIIPLHELIAIALGSTLSSKKTWQVYNHLIERFENELNILLNVEKGNLVREGVNENLIDLVIKNRNGKLKIKPGYDGVYGEIILEEKQTKLF